MIRKIFIGLFVMAIAGQVSYSQGKFGKPDKDELLLTESQLDSESEAEFLSKTCKVYFSYNENLGFSKNREVKASLKIYDKDEAASWATVIVSLFGEESISNFKAYTHNLVDGKVVTEKISKKDIFTEEVDDDWVRKRFTFPNVQDGSILEWTYVITSQYFRYIEEFYFQHSIPVKYASFEISTPEYFVYQSHMTGFEYPFDVIDGTSTGSAVIGHNNFTYVNTDKKLVYTDVPALRDEKYVYNITNYRNSIRYELVRTNIPLQTVKLYSATWESIAKELMENSHFGGQVSRSNYYKAQMQELNAELEGKSVAGKTEIIFKYVQQSMQWNKKKRLYTNEGVRKAFDAKIGNSSEINLILVSMLRSAGINANPLALSTVDNGFIGHSFPSKSKLNFVIAAVEDENKLYLMDASNKYSSINVLPHYCLNYRGFIIYENNGAKEVSVVNSRMTISTSIQCELNENNEISGSYLSKEGGQNTIHKRKSIHDSKDNFIEELHKANSDVIKSDISFENEDNANELLITSYNFSESTSLQEIGGKIFISPLLFEEQKENPFKNENRLFAVEFGNQLSETCMVAITIPEEYQVEYLPQAAKYKLPNGLGSYTFMIQHMNGSVNVTKMLKLNRAIYSPDEAKMLRQLFINIVEKETDKIVLVKKE